MSERLNTVPRWEDGHTLLGDTFYYRVSPYDGYLYARLKNTENKDL